MFLNSLNDAAPMNFEKLILCFSNESAPLISFCSVGSVVGADGGKLEALYNKPTTDLHPQLSYSQNTT